MTRRMFVFDPPDRFVAGTVGEPGNRTFFLQARRGSQVVSVALEKVQVAVLADRLGQLLDELDARGITDVPAEAVSAEPAPLDEPINEAFRASSLTLGWDGDAERILVEARAPGDDEDEDDDAAEAAEEEDDAPETAGLDPAALERLRSIEGLDPAIAARFLTALEATEEDDDDNDDGPDLLRVRMSARDAREFVERAVRVVASGRPPCPLCGQPLDPQGHLCPRRNGHYVN